MTQNIYDDPAFFAGYSALRRSIDGLAGAAEWSSLRAMLPAMAGLRVLDLGCGFGWFCRWAQTEGAATVLGVDVSENMLARARETTAAPAITYARADLETFVPDVGAYDLVYSSLALHYIAGLDRLMAAVHAALAPGGHLVFSVEHPIYTAPTSAAWVTSGGKPPIWPLDGYLREGPRRTNWLAEGVIKQHRSIATYVTALLRAGFTLTALDEWGPTTAQVAERPDWAVERDRPPFLLVAARR